MLVSNNMYAPGFAHTLSSLQSTIVCDPPKTILVTLVPFLVFFIFMHHAQCTQEPNPVTKVATQEYRSKAPQKSDQFRNSSEERVLRAVCAREGLARVLRYRWGGAHRGGETRGRRNLGMHIHSVWSPAARAVSIARSSAVVQAHRHSGVPLRPRVARWTHTSSFAMHSGAADHAPTARGTPALALGAQDPMQAGFFGSRTKCQSWVADSHRE